jgi:AcrR family transcriptional regulator
MTTFTKQAIMQAFQELVNEERFDQISVQDIADRCGISRNTFYYHFGDIYALVEAILQQEIENLKNWQSECHSRLERIQHDISWLLENRQATYNIYNSVNHALLQQWIYRITEDLIIANVEQEISAENLSEDDKKFICLMYQAMFTGLVLEWIRTGMKGDPSERLWQAERSFFEGVKAIIAGSGM